MKGSWLDIVIIIGQNLVVSHDEGEELRVQALACLPAAASISRMNSQPQAQLDGLLVSDEGIKYLCPEVVLLYKSKHPRAEDEHDFMFGVPQLEEEQRGWLKDSIAICEAEHHWL